MTAAMTATVELAAGARDPWEAAARRFEGIDSDDVYVRWSPFALAQRLDRRIIRTPALDLVDRAIVDWITGRQLRTMIVLGPQEGKTTGVRYGCLQGLRYDPMLRFAVASYSDRMARRVPRWVRNDAEAHPALGLRLADDQKAAGDWRLDNGVGGMYGAGVGGSWSGEPVDRLIIDDVFKDRDAADSEVRRETVRDWWSSTATARLSEGGAVLIVNTRWHHDDLIGQLLKADRLSGLAEWRVIHIPAQADPKVLDPDPLGRAAGEFMVSARGRTTESWERRKREAGDQWMPVYQGAPSNPGGDVFDPDRLHWWTLTPDGRGVATGPAGAGRVWPLSQCRRFVTIDTATSTRGTADYTVASAWAVPPDGTLILLDVRRDRVPEHRQIELARPLVQRWRVDCVYVEATMAGTRLVRDAVAAGIRIDDLKADRGKTVRNAPAAKWVEQGRVWFPAPASATALPADLLRDVLEELRQFPSGRHDDFVDTLGYAVAVVMDTYMPPWSGRDDPGVVAARERVGVVERAVAEGAVDDWMTRPM